MAEGALGVVACVCYQLHVVIFVAQSGVDVQFAERNVGCEISGSEIVVALIVVAHVLFLEQIQAVGTEVALVAEHLRQVVLAESVGQRVAGSVPVVDKVAGGVLTCAVFAVGSKLERRCE